LFALNVFCPLLLVLKYVTFLPTSQRHDTTTAVLNSNSILQGYAITWTTLPFLDTSSSFLTTMHFSARRDDVSDGEKKLPDPSQERSSFLELLLGIPADTQDKIYTFFLKRRIGLEDVEKILEILLKISEIEICSSRRQRRVYIYTGSRRRTGVKICGEKTCIKVILETRTGEETSPVSSKLKITVEEASASLEDNTEEEVDESSKPKETKDRR